MEELTALIERVKKRADETKPFWQRATPQARAGELLKWSAQQSQSGMSLPDEAFDRGTIYN